MPISSYVIRCAPVDQPAVQDRLRALPGVELGEPMAAGIPVVADTPTTRAAEELGAQLQQVPGVKSAVLVYHNFEDVADEPAPLPDGFRTS
ncbi:MAG: chaperone NapD [Verrucomicrobia bacterium]|nr:chaperone NapD [Verrucomicrobiota bacterium]